MSKTTKDPLGDRMKSFEAHETGRRFLPGLPIYARIDGRSFSKLTRGLKRPFDPVFTNIMIKTAKVLVDHTHARSGYVQSDEISLVWQIDSPESSLFFDGKTMKMASVLAGLATAAFTKAMLDAGGEYADRLRMLPHFDCRVMMMPSRTEATNMMLWRNFDATKNAVSMAARHFYSAKALHGKSSVEMLDMIADKGQSFSDYPTAFRHGTWVQRQTTDRQLTKEELERIPEGHCPDKNELVTRSEIIAFSMPNMSRVMNREDVVFDGVLPVILSGILAP